MPCRIYKWKNGLEHNGRGVQQQELQGFQRVGYQPTFPHFEGHYIALTQFAKKKSKVERKKFKNFLIFVFFATFYTVFGLRTLLAMRIICCWYPSVRPNFLPNLVLRHFFIKNFIFIFLLKCCKNLETNKKRPTFRSRAAPGPGSPTPAQ
jgi:hypothetical protein